MPAKTVIENHKLYVDHPNLPEGKTFIELLYLPNSHAYKIDGDKKIGVTGVTDILEKEGLRYYYMNEALASVTRTLIPENDGVFQMPESLEEWDAACKQAKSAHLIRSGRGKENGTRTHSWIEEFLTSKRDGTEPPALPEPEKVPKAAPGMSWEELADIEVKVEYNNLIDALSQFVDWFDAHEIEIVDFERIIYSLTYDYAGRFDAILRIDGKLYLVDFKTNNPTSEYPDGIFPEMFCQIGGYDVAYTEEYAPELHAKNQSMFDGYAVFNFSKKTGQFKKRFTTPEDVKVNRTWFVHTLGAKRGAQYNMRKMSLKYKENRPQIKRKG